MAVAAAHQPPTSPPHVLIIPFPSQGHMLPLLDLARLLSLRRIENAKDLPPPIIPNLAILMQAHCYLRAPIIEWARSTPNPPTAVIADFFCGWAHSLARSLSVPSLVFCAYGPFSLSLVHRLWLDLPSPSASPDPVSFPSVPGSPSLPWAHLSSMYREYQAHRLDTLWEFVRASFLSNFTSPSALLFDSFDALESPYLSHVRAAFPCSPVLALGPLNMDRKGTGGGEGAALLAWLDGFSAGAVTYVSFGSQAALSRAQGRALASGLERSGVAFVWRVREDEEEVIPEGFEGRVRGRGLVVRGWAPQVEALRHVAVGAFLTHCGWNSVLEGVASGVALLAWPMMADQFTNARLVVDEVGMGVRVCEGADRVPDREVIARAVAGGGGKERAKAEEMRRKATEAVGEGGSSWRDMEAMIHLLHLKGYSSDDTTTTTS